MKIVKIKGTPTTTYDKYKALKDANFDPYYTDEHLEVNVPQFSYYQIMMIMQPELKCKHCNDNFAHKAGAPCQECCMNGKAYGSSWSLD
jgi:hypothetical protein